MEPNLRVNTPNIIMETKLRSKITKDDRQTKILSLNEKRLKFD